MFVMSCVRGCNPKQVYIILDILPYCPTDFATPPSTQNGFVQSAARERARAPDDSGGPFHKYSAVRLRGDRFPAFSTRASEVPRKENLKMMNGEMNGFHSSLIEEDCFLFTSESVGEGHPGKL